MITVSCDFCGERDTALIFQANDTNYHFAGTFNVVKCRSCSLCYINPRPDEAEIFHYYPLHYTCFRSSSSASSLGRKHPFAQVTRQLGIRPGRLCDIGAGVGDFLIAAQGSGWQVAGVEINEGARQICNERLGPNVVVESLDTAPFSAELFDAVTLWHTLEHVQSPTKTLKQIHRILAPEGLLGIAVPNFDSLERRIWGPRWIAVMAPTHMYHFTESTLRRYVESQGFRVVSVHQAPAANSLSANILRSAREIVLDRMARRRQAQRSSTRSNAGCSSSLPSQADYVGTIGETAKGRVRDAVANLVAPAAWVISKAGLGPELMLYARRE